MSDDRDETRPFAPSADATRPDATKPADDATPAGDTTPAGDPRVDDATQLDLPRVDDATQAGLPPVGDATRIDAAPAGPAAQPVRRPPVRRPRPDATSVMPAADDWAPGRGNPAWTGRAEVRAPRPGGSTYTEQDEWAAPVIRPQAVPQALL